MQDTPQNTRQDTHIIAQCESCERKITSLFTEWLLRGDVQKLVVVISDAGSKEVLERWVFDVITEKPGPEGCVLFLN